MCNTFDETPVGLVEKENTSDRNHGDEGHRDVKLTHRQPLNTQNDRGRGDTRAQCDG